MRNPPASIRVTRVGQEALSLTWTAAIVVPSTVQVEVVDFGHRVDVVVTRRDEEVSVLEDLATGARILQTNGAEGSLLVSFAMNLLDARRSALSEDLISIRSSDENPQFENLADAVGAQYIPYGAVTWPLPPEIAGGDFVDD